MTQDPHQPADLSQDAPTAPYGAPAGQPASPPMGQPLDQPMPPAPYGGYSGPGAMVADGPLGKVRSTGVCILLTVVTLGFYTWYWYYATHDEMKRHTGQGVDGAVALVLGIFLSIVMAFLTPNDVGALYERKGWAKPVSAVTGLWALLLGWFFFVGAIVWFVKTNGALNAYWRSQGAQG